MSPNQRLSTARTLTVAPNDTTVGTETELQVAVYGSRFDVDLPRTIESSNYFANAIRRAATGKRKTD